MADLNNNTENIKENNDEGNIENAQSQANGEAKAQGEKSPNEDNGEIVLSAQQFDEIKVKVEAIQKERDEFLNAAKRVQADFDNFRRRNASVRTESIDEGRGEVIKAMLPVLDNFERALDAAENGDNAHVSAFIDGMEMIYRQFFSELSKLGLCEIECVGAEFDPLSHEALMQDHNADCPSGVVVSVIQKGYTMGGKILRSAKVVVRA